MRWLGVLGATIGGLFILFSIYFFLYVSSQKAYIINRNFRQLALVSNQLQSQIENYTRNVLINTVKVDFDDIKLISNQLQSQIDNYEKKLSKNTANVDLGNIKLVREGCESGDKECVRNLIRKRIALIPALNLIGDVEFSSATKPILKFMPNGKRIIFQYEGPISRNKSSTDSLSPEIAVKFFVDTGFEDLIGSNAGKWFQGVFIVDKNSEIKAHQLEDEISLNRLRIALKDGKPGEFQEVGNVSDVIDIKVSGNNFKLFVYPIQLYIDESNVEKWIVCALIPAEQFHGESLSVSYTVLILFVLCFLIASLSMPYLKVLLMGGGDKLQRVDVRFLAISTFFGSAILALFLCDLVFYKNLELELDSQLEQFSNSIQKNFDNELQKMVLQLEAFSNVVKFSAGKESRVDLLRDEGPNIGHYPYFEMAFWIDGAGRQRTKWTIRKSTTPFIDVTKREYFSNVRDGHLIKRTFNKKDYEFSLLPIYSRNTGENLVVLSASHRWPEANDEKWVSAMDVKFLSLLETVVPVSYGYAVLEGDGRVLFHSSSDRNLRENFVKESENNKQLRAALFAHSQDFISSKYTGMGHRLFVTPIRDFPWSLVVFRNKQLLRTSNAEILSISLFLLLFYSVILFVGIGVIRLYSPNFFRNFIWPNENKIEDYLLWLITYFLLSVVFFVAIMILDPPKLFLWILLWPLLLLLITILIFRIRQSNQEFAFHKIFKVKSLPWRRRIGFLQASYLGLLTFVVLLTGILPAIGIFKIAHDYEMSLLVKYGQLSLTQEMHVREQRIKEEYRDVQLPEGFLEKRLEEPSDVYYDFVFGTKMAKAGTETNSTPKVQPSITSYWPWEFFSLIRPLYNRNAIETDRLWKDSSADDSFKWSGKDQLHMRTDGTILSSEIPRFKLFDFWFWWTSLIVLLLIFFLLLRFAAKRIFLLGVRFPSASQTAALLPEQVKKNLLILGPPYSGKSDLLITGNFKVFDLRKVAVEKDLVEQYHAMELSKSQNNIIAIDHLEHKMGNPEVNRKKCDLLEELLNEGKRVVVVSALYPSYFCFGEDAGNVAYPERWANIFSTFTNISMSSRGDPDSFLKVISSLENKLDKDLLDCLREECKPTAYLQNIGKEMLTLDHISDLDRQQLISEIFDSAYSYYQTIWNACTDGEKHALYDLAEDGLVNTRNAGLITLMRKGLILREPNLKIMNQSFKRFVLLAGIREDIAHRRQEGEISTWSMMRVPFSVILITVAAFLFISQREIFQSTTALVASLSASVPALFNLLGTVRGGRSKPTV